VKRKLPTLVWPLDYYTLLIFQVGSSEVAARSLRAIKRDFRALGQLVKGSGALVVFCSIPPVAGNNEGRRRKSQQINTWLQAWCHQWDSGFLDHMLLYMTPGLLVADSVHLSQRGKRILVQELARLTERALN